MRVAAWVDGYPPGLLTGASISIHEILIGLRARGHEVRAFCTQNYSGEFEGVQVSRIIAGGLEEAQQWADVVLTQTSASHSASIHVGKTKPLVYLNHDPAALQAEMPRGCRSLMVIFNSEAALLAVDPPEGSMVIHPPVSPSRYAADRGDCVTIINLNANKGGALLYRLASAMPDRQFLGVKGAYDAQIIPARRPANVRIESLTADMRSIYSQTRLLLIPSQRETYGRVGIEAYASGIPVIASPTDGLREALGDAGIFAAHGETQEWIDQIAALDDPNIYRMASERAQARSAALDPAPAIARLEERLADMMSRFE